MRREIQISEVQVFQDDEQGYKGWLADHGRGFVLNVSTGKVHRSTCKHIRNYEAPHIKQTRNTKVCAARLDEIRRWATTHGVALRTSRCQSCDVWAPGFRIGYRGH